MPGLDDLSRLFRGRARPEPEALDCYATAVRPLLEQLRSLYQRWHQDLELDAPDDDLANAASIQRWEAAGLRDRLAEIEPPPPLARAHADLLALVTDTVRAAQLLSNGYRFHSSRARCDGQALMLEADERFRPLLQNLEQLGVRFAADADAGAAGRRSPDS